MKRIYITLVILVLVLTMSLYLYSNERQKAADPEDIQIEATLKPNENEKLDYYEYMLEVVIDKKKESSHIIYPYIKGLGVISFDHDDAEDGYYIPNSIGSGSGDEEMVTNSYREHNIIYNQNEVTFIGFYSPEEAGVHKMRIYLEKREDINPSDKKYLTYVHRGEGKFGLDDSWTKIIEVKSEL